MWFVGFPVAVVPSWQLAQVPVTVLWSTATASQSVLTWQSSQTLPLAIWSVGLPVAVVPSWQLAQVPVTVLWSTATVSQLVLT